MSIVCDTGTGYLKLGWSISTYPDYIIPTMLGRPNKRYKEMESDQTKLEVKFS
jgi:actin-related protein